MFYGLAMVLPFRSKGMQWAVVMVLYGILFMGNQAFSLYLVFGKVLNQSHGKAELTASAASEGHGGIASTAFSSTGQEAYLGKQLFELLFPGSLLIPYLTWPLIGYPLRRWLRRYNNFIPFTDDIHGARMLELRNTEVWVVGEVFNHRKDEVRILGFWCE